MCGWAVPIVRFVRELARSQLRGVTHTWLSRYKLEAGLLNKGINRTGG